LISHPLIYYCLAAGIVLAMLQHHVILADPDTGWHIRAGDLLRASDTWPEHDPWSWTAGTHPWRNIAWLPDMGMSFLHELGELTLIKKTSILIFGLTAAALAALAVNLGATLPATAIALFYTLGVLCSGLLARPQLLSMLLAVAIYVIARGASRRMQWWIVPLQWLWANSHGGYVTTYILLGILFLEALVQKQKDTMRHLLLLGISCLLVVIINPYGLGLFVVTFDLLSTPANAMISEWRATAPAENIYLLGWLVLMVISGGMLHRDIRLCDKLLAIFWLVMGMMSARLSYFSALYAFPFLVASLSLWKEHLSGIKHPPVTMLNTIKHRRRSLISVIVTLALLVSPLPDAVWEKPQISPGNNPEQEVAFILSHYPKLRFFTHFNFGGAIIYDTNGALKPFMDGRTETAYSRQVMRDYIEIQDLRPASDSQRGWERLAEDYGIEGFLIPKHDIFAPEKLAVQPQILELSGQWVHAFTGDAAHVYIRKDLLINNR
jgi:hypothetical protein